MKIILIYSSVHFGIWFDSAYSLFVFVMKNWLSKYILGQFIFTQFGSTSAFQLTALWVCPHKRRSDTWVTCILVVHRAMLFRKIKDTSASKPKGGLWRQLDWLKCNLMNHICNYIVKIWAMQHWFEDLFFAYSMTVTFWEMCIMEKPESDLIISWGFFYTKIFNTLINL